MLGADDMDRLACLEDGPHAVRPDVPLGVLEAGGERDAVQARPDRRAGVESAEDAGLAVGERDAQRNVRGLVTEPVDDRLGRADQAGGGVEVLEVLRAHLVGVHPRLQGALPGRGHDLRNGTGHRRTCRQEVGTGARSTSSLVGWVHGSAPSFPMIALGIGAVKGSAVATTGRNDRVRM
jgi:hypothetical protein